jgi:hypothetical protein
VLQTDQAAVLQVLDDCVCEQRIPFRKSLHEAGHAAGDARGAELELETAADPRGVERLESQLVAQPMQDEIVLEPLQR